MLETRVLDTDLLLDLQDLPLELALDLSVLGLDSLQSFDTSLDSGSQRLDVSRRLADQRSETVLHHAEKSGVLPCIAKDVRLHKPRRCVEVKRREISTDPSEHTGRVSTLGLILLLSDSSNSRLGKSVTARNGCGIERGVHGGRRLYCTQVVQIYAVKVD